MFIQAGNSLFALLMVYKIAGPHIGNKLEYTFKDCGLIPLSIMLAIGTPFLIAPQILVSRTLRKSMIKVDEVPQILYDEGLLEEEDQDKVLIRTDQVKTLNFSITILSIVIILASLMKYWGKGKIRY